MARTKAQREFARRSAASTKGWETRRANEAARQLQKWDRAVKRAIERLPTVVGEGSRRAVIRERLRAAIGRERSQRWDVWAERARERQPGLQVNTGSAEEKGAKPDATTPMGWQTLGAYVSTPNQAAWAEWVADGRAARITEHWTRTGVLPPWAADAPVDRWEQDHHFRTAPEMLSGVFAEPFAATLAVRVDARITERSKSYRSLLNKGSRFVRVRRSALDNRLK